MNILGPFLIMKELVPLLKSENEENFPVVATIGSAMGSISALPNHRSAPYRVSKVISSFYYFVKLGLIISFSSVLFI